MSAHQGRVEDAGQAEKENGAQCPFDHPMPSQQKTARALVLSDHAIDRDEAGIWHVRGFEEARAVLRSSETVQAGFGADFVTRAPGATNIPVLYMEGQAHHQQRRQIARFFTPKFVSDNYRPLMERQVSQLISEAVKKKQFDLSIMSRTLAVRVAGEVVGLTSSLLPGMAQRLDSFFHGQGTSPSVPGLPGKILTVWSQRKILSFFYLDVKPAIRARKRRAQQDVISSLIAQNYSDQDILTECVTYGAAGMVTTREFISIATWHFMEQPELRARYLVASEKERYAILAEVLRLEPVVSHLFRRATSAIELKSDDQSVTIPEGALIDIGIYETNLDQDIVGEEPRALCPEREMHGDRVPSEMMSFGDGAHRCPGSSIAVQETDTLLRQLFALKGLRMVHPPKLTWNDFIKSYELRDFQLAID